MENEEHMTGGLLPSTAVVNGERSRRYKARFGFPSWVGIDL